MDASFFAADGTKFVSGKFNGFLPLGFEYHYVPKFCEFKGHDGGRQVNRNKQREEHNSSLIYID